MRKCYLFLLLPVYLSTGLVLQAQCPITVYAGEDVWLCAPPTPTQLDGSIDGDYLNFNWSPTSGMTGATTLTPTVNVSQTTTYVLTALAADPGNNVIENGDFENGNVGFTSDYVYNPGFTLPPWGSYEVTTTPTIFPNCGDHTSGSGQYMVVDGADVPNLYVWCQTVPVMPNTDYLLSAWGVSFTNASPFAGLEFTINGSMVGSLFSIPGPSCTWRHFTAIWNSGANTSANICIENLTVTGANNDFALDDISMSPICQQTDSVTVHVVNIVAAASPAVSIIPCDGANVTLSGTGSSTGSDITYEWDGPGIVSGQNTLSPVVNASGNYTLTVTFNNGSVMCTKTASISVIESPNPLIAWIDPPSPLGCGASTTTLIGHSNQPGFSTYLWTAGPGGNIVSGQNTPNAVVNQPGDYTLLVTNTSTGCTAEVNVSVSANTNLPTAMAAASGTITCQQPLVDLSGAGSSTGSTMSYAWVALTGGNIVSGQMALNAVVNGPGTYVLTVTNSANNCTATDTVTVNSTATPPEIDIAAAGIFNCITDTLGLSASITPVFSTPVWTAAGGGAIVSGDSTLTPQISGAGTYFLMATDTVTGCSATDSIVVIADLTPPVPAIQPADTLNCQLTSITLSATASDTGGNPTWLWMATAGGNIVSGADSPNPVVDAPGVYTLTVTNSANGCTGTASVTVNETVDLPPVDAGPDGAVTCTDPVFTLTADTSLAGSGFLYNWQTPNGNFASNPDSTIVDCDQPGIYLLTVTNPANGCTATDTAIVVANQLPPAVSLLPPPVLTCAQTTATIGITGGSPDFVYQWQTTGGQFVSGQNTDAPVVDLPGLYTLTVTDTLNGCIANLSVTVGQDTAIPAASIAPAPTLTCILLQTTLQGAVEPGAGIQVIWTASGGGNIVSGAGTPTPVVDQPGIYLLTVTNTANGCTNTASLDVTQNIAAPSANAGPDTTLGCLVSTLTLQGTGAATGIPSYAWTATGGGSILSGANTLSPLIGTPGNYTLVVTDQQNGCTASDVAVVQQDADAPVAAIDPPGLLTCAVTQLTLQGNASAGPDFTYQWSASGGGNIVAGANTLTPAINQPGMYTLIVTNTLNGCTSAAQSNVDQNIAPPQPVIAQPGTLNCATTSLSLSASPTGAGYDYLWQTTNGLIVSGNTTPTPVVSQAGNYTLTLTSLDNGCTATAVATVAIDTLHPVLATAPPQELTCVLQQLILSGSVSQPAANFSAQWSTNDGQFVSGQNTLTPTISAPGTYLLTVQHLANGCTGTVATTVLQNTTPPLADAGPAPLITCAQPQVSLDASASSGQGALGFAWSGGQIVNGANTAMPTVSAPGAYTLTLTDAINGCTATATVTVGQNTTPPTVLIAAPELLTCAQTGATLNAAASSSGTGFALSWTTSNGNFSAGQNTLTPVVDAAGSYTLTIVNQQNGCSAAASITVAEDKTAPHAEAGPGDQLDCQHLQTTLQGSSNTPGTMSFTWSTLNGNFITPANSANPQVDAAGTYLLTVTNPANGCTATDQVSVTQTLPPAFSPELVQPDCHLPTGAVTFAAPGGGTQPYAFSIDGGQNYLSTPAFSALAPGIYQLVLRDADGCTDEQSVTIDPPLFPSVDLPDLYEIELGDSVLLSPFTNPPAANIADWQWTPANGLSCDDCPEPWGKPLETVRYTLVITDLNGCTATDRTEVRVDRRRKIFVPNVFSPNDDGINDLFSLYGRSVVQVRSLQVFNRWGELVFSATDIPANQETAGWDGSFRGQAATPGVYVWQAEVEFIDGQTERYAGDVTLVR